ncbi:4-phosphoerythronate dehydrogenase PdxB [Plebeiibacterium sediminum]|uniref:Erythronate-4-phosphate dehydrogenase n=1 Tax=Plebeiibacterium sediminum TaxID=2992112 RepID=A0AAE3M0M7_9BACT|nr:4-phosphoerythronate dehydrogenase PdxB [Plebeiobacterium sediminum]MCW3784991.1 4-phosphoerythronate dehydrogenase PdxB [Plebeiobacterium sediminum]
MLKIIADDKIPFLQGVLEPYAHMVYVAGSETTGDLVKEADALITRTRTKCNKSLLEGSNVKMIATATIGFDHIDTHYCDAADIKWVNAPGCNSGSVKQYIASALAILAIKKNYKFKDITIGIVGVGNVGSKVKALSEALGIKVLVNDPPRAKAENSVEFVDLKTIQKEADIITFHVPLQREGEYKTYHLANESFFKSCKNDVVIINSSRGEVVDNQSLLKALNEKSVGEAVLDVWESEPDIDTALLNKTIIATPHIAGYSVDGKANGTAMSVQAISKKFNLPLTEWYPDGLPLPDNELIEIDGNGKTDQEILIEAILHTYNILNDDSKMRMHPEEFEKQRGSYPVRREFGAFNVELKNSSNFIVESLNKIGFATVKLI